MEHPVLGGLPRAPKRRNPSANHALRKPAALPQSIDPAIHKALQAWVGEQKPGEQRAEALARILACTSWPLGAPRHLVLMGLGLQELPPHLGSLQPLNSLLLAGNSLTGFLDFSTLPGLRRLFLNGNDLEVPPELRMLGHLRTLNLHDNRLTVAPDLSGSKLLKDVNLGDNRLVAMPDVREHKYLKRLDLSENWLRTLPDWFAQLPAGMKIDLTGNPLTNETLIGLEALRSTGLGPKIRFDNDAGAAVHNALSSWTEAAKSFEQDGRSIAATRVAHCLHDNLHDLDLQQLLLSELPPYVAALSQLERLDLSLNNFNAAPDLHEQTALLLLNLHCNCIAIPPDIRQSRSLQCAYLNDNRLVAMPDVRGLGHLRELDLYNNCLRTVPYWLAELPREMQIDLRANPLSGAALVYLHELSATQRGPEIRFFPLEAPEPEAQVSLVEQIDFWLDALAATSVISRNNEPLRDRWAGFQCQNELSAGNFALLLRELTVTADFQNGDALRAALIQRVFGVLEALPCDEALRLQCFDIAEAATGTCGDGVAIAFGNIEMAARAQQLAGNPPALWELARGHFRLDQVNRIAAQDREALQGTVEDVEVALSYRIHLAKELQLPAQPGEMLYAYLVNVSPEKLEQAAKDVLAAEQEPGALARYIAAQPFWRTSLEQQAPCAEAIEALRENLLRQLEDLEHEGEAPGSSLTSSAYLARQRQINETHRTDLDALYLRFTHAYDEARTVVAF